MSGSSDYTTTPNLGLFMPNYDMDDGTWGAHLNSNASVLDSAVHALQGSTAGGPFLPLTGGTVTANMTGTAQAGAIWLNSTATGSGVNGPGTTQIALAIVHEKTNYLTTSNVGEIDGIYVTARQGGPTSDVGGLVVDVGNTGSGFTTILEGASHQMAPTTGTITRSIRAQLCTLNPIAATYQGLYLMAETGTSSTALMISDTPGQGQWTNFIEGWQNNSQNLVATGSGNLWIHGQLSTGPIANAVNVGTTANTSPAGAYLQFNRGGDGTTWLISTAGGGSSAGISLAQSSSSSVITPLLSLYTSGIYFGTGVPLHFSNGAPWNMPTDLVNAANDAAAGAAGVAVGVMYRNGSVLQVRVV